MLSVCSALLRNWRKCCGCCSVAGLDAEGWRLHHQAVTLDTLPELTANAIPHPEPVTDSNPYEPLEGAAETTEAATSAH
jgi:hypothetical protein